MDLHVSLIGRTDLSGEIYRQLRGAIRDGRLRRGDRLPPSRQLARRLTVSRTTVTVAYERLMGEGFLTARVGAGTFVSDQISAPASRAGQRHVKSPLRAQPFWEQFPAFAQAFVRPAEFDFRSGLPDASLFPHEEWRRAVAQQLRRTASDRGVYGPPAGLQALREAIARHIGTSRSVQTAADDITVTNGTQQALDVVARVLLAPGDRVAVEAPGYSPARVLFESLGARVTGVPVDEAGLVVDALPRQTRVVYVTPSHQYPLGVSMALRRRAELLAWADRHDAAIIEDDYDSEFRFRGRPIEPLQTLDTTGRVIYVGSFSKTMLPTLRLGFAVTPPSLTRAVQAAKYVADWHTALPLQAALARFIEDGSFARHIRKMNVVYQARHDLISDVVARKFSECLQLIPSVVGLHVTAFARVHTTEQLRAVVRRASAMSVEVQELATFAVGAPTHVGLVLAYGAIPTASIAEGLRRLRSCFDTDRSVEALRRS
jgi:GntR family transcriptional regulator/MocR family aminotransferase